jgi:hypothetical protein
MRLLDEAVFDGKTMHPIYRHASSAQQLREELFTPCMHAVTEATKA